MKPIKPVGGLNGYAGGDLDPLDGIDEQETQPPVEG
jgi:hypothetical protein